MRTGLLILALLVSQSHIVAQQSDPEQQGTILPILNGMKSRSQAERESAFKKASKLLVSHKIAGNDSDRLRLGLIELLSAENARNTVSDEELSKVEGCRNNKDNCADNAEEIQPKMVYLYRLTSTVASFHDERAIPALAGAMGRGDGIKSALLKFGEKAIGPVTEQLKSPNYSLRLLALDVSVSLLQAQPDSASRAHIREIIESALTDAMSVVRSHAVKKITCLSDRQDYVSSLENIAKTDPLKLSGKPLDGGDGGRFFPVRADARRALRTIQSNGACLLD